MERINEFKGDQGVIINHFFVNGIFDQNIINVLLSIPREVFLDADRKSLANIDACIPYGVEGRYLLDLVTAAKMLRVIKGAHDNPKSILIIGAGRGYLSAILSRIADEVHALDDSEVLIDEAKDIMRKLRIANVYHVYDNILDPTLRLKADLVIVEGAFLTMNRAWLEFLNESGIFVGIQRVNCISKIISFLKHNNDYLREEHDMVAAPLVPVFGIKEEFVF